MSDSGKVCALIVTYRRPETLARCLGALMAQRADGLDHIHVVANADDVETVHVVDRIAGQEGDFISLEHRDNEGPAGGFHYALKRFLEGTWEHAWLMDDDVVVEAGCLRELFSCKGDRPYAYPKVIKENGEEVVSFGWWGVMIARELVEKAGLPIKELFYWAEDTEYLQNRIMRQLGEVPCRCPSAVVRHLHYRAGKRPSWYYYYTVRNTLYYRNYLAGYTWYRVKRTLFLLPHSLYMILLREDNKIRKIRLLFYGLYHGMIGKIGKLVDPSLHK